MKSWEIYKSSLFCTGMQIKVLVYFLVERVSNNNNKKTNYDPLYLTFKVKI
jgi:hypothetical protein